MKHIKGSAGSRILIGLVVVGLSIPISGLAYGLMEPEQPFSGQIRKKISGIINMREDETFTLRDELGTEVTVVTTKDTIVKERKSNPFRDPKNYDATDLLRGLRVEVDVRRNIDGKVFAEQIRFTEDALRAANTLDSRIGPVEGQLNQASLRLARTQEETQYLNGQVRDLNSISNAARGGAKGAQDTADDALAGVNLANEKIQRANEHIQMANSRITALDDFDVRGQKTIQFDPGRSILSREAKETIDALAELAKGDRGYVVEVTGFASSDGDQSLNRRLSQKRAEAVVAYLIENHMIPLRRIVTPFGYGEKLPVADNKTRDGRIQNRRVEVKILVNKGLGSSMKSSGNN